MKINSTDFCVRERDEANLQKWPTNIKSVDMSKQQYRKLLEEAKMGRPSLNLILFSFRPDSL